MAKKKYGKELYDYVCLETSKNLTKSYTTSFSLGIRLFAKPIRNPIYSIYGFVRLADEIVDTFHEQNQEKLLEEFRQQTYQSIEAGLSTNPVLHSFQATVNKYNIPLDLIESFLQSMAMDLKPIDYDKKTYNKYIYGSAEVVGLMCLKVFVQGNEEKYNELKPSAQVLGSVFQKINFLRDVHYDFKQLNRSYFPNLNLDNLNETELKEVFKEIESEFDQALEGIMKLPASSRFGVYLGYRYFRKLFNKIRRTKSDQILKERIRIPNGIKYSIFLRSYVRHRINWY